MQLCDSRFKCARLAPKLLLSAACAVVCACNAVSPDSEDGPERETPALDAGRDVQTGLDTAPDDAATEDAAQGDTTDASQEDTTENETVEPDADATESDTENEDAGTTDTGTTDTGTTDTGTTDTGTTDTGTTDTGTTDTGTTDTGTPDAGAPDAGECDLDLDGALADSCGGLDCDDTTALIGPEVLERCDFDDNNCNGEVNEGLDCRVYVHSSSRLYLSDPFLGTLDELGSVPSLFDLDTSPDGTVYGVTSSRTLQRFDGMSWSLVGSLSGIAANLNGFAIDGFGRAFGTGGTSLFGIDTTTGTSTTVSTSTGYTSSGDCVVDKNDVLFMTATGVGGDDLVVLDTATGAGRLIGGVGFDGVYGLTATYGFMFGFTGSGEVIEIDPNTGTGRLLHTHSGIQFYGAASSSNR
ncbi:MAG: hypothetical protein ACI81R_001365 [Bradymonadia bacterium]|jgi:hypothetical protein